MCLQQPPSINLLDPLVQVSMEYPNDENTHAVNLVPVIDHFIRSWPLLYTHRSKRAGNLPMCAWVAIHHKNLLNEEYNIAYIYPNHEHRIKNEKSKFGLQIPYVTLSLLGRARRLNPASKCRPTQELISCANTLRQHADLIMNKNQTCYNQNFKARLNPHLNLQGRTGFCVCFEHVSAYHLRYDFNNMPSNQILVDDLCKFTELFLSLVENFGAICQIQT